MKGNNDMEATLKPCPFCNGACRDHKNGPKLNHWWEVVCDECDFCGPAFHTEQEAVDHWNTRAPAWQPIETAPWEGPPVLLYRDGEMFTAMRVRGEHGPGWCTPDGFSIFRATHWMPLPPAPKGLSKEIARQNRLAEHHSEKAADHLRQAREIAAQLSMRHPNKEGE